MSDARELKKAVALLYEGEQAPTVVAKGEGLEAEEIVRIARESGVPLCDNPPLVELLAQIELGEEIPEALYVAVAHIIAFAYKLRLQLIHEPPTKGPVTPHL